MPFALTNEVLPNAFKNNTKSHLNEHAGLVVGVGGENSGLLCGYGGVPGDQRRHHAARRLNAERKGSHVEQ